METGDQTRVKWLKEGEEEVLDRREYKEPKVRMSLYIEESIKTAVAQEARRLSARSEKRVPMSDVVKRALIYYFKALHEGDNE